MINHRRFLALTIILTALWLTLRQSVAAEALPGKARLNLVFVLDGLRPDSVNPEDTPNIYKLRQEGVNYVNGHSVFPTVTRVNTAAISTGTYPGTNGILGNSMYVREVNPTRSFSTDNYANLLKLDEVSGGKMVLVKSLGELLEARGVKFAAIGSASNGQSLLLNPRAPQGVGVLVNGYIEAGKLVAYPPKANAEILSRFGPAPRKTRQTLSEKTSVDWTMEVLREYVIPELKPEVTLAWMSEPDHTQHVLGVGSPEARAALQNDDRHIGLILKKLEALELIDQTNIFLISDHGFGAMVFGVNVNRELINAGLKAGVDSDDVVSASSGGAVLLHVKDHNAERIKRIVKFLQSQEWSGAIFTAGNNQSSDGRALGSLEGTFSLELIHMFNRERGPDIVLTFPWSSAKNAFGIPGTDYSNTTRATGPIKSPASNHGSMSPWDVHNTFIAWGVDFKRGASVRIPASNADIAPTLLALKGIGDTKNLEGRVLREALNGGPDEEQIPETKRTYTTETADGKYEAVISVTEVEHERYIDKSWRVR
ncbi:MAG: alkaline phosphatase family protein [Alphaproteobacteria bacterium]